MPEDLHLCSPLFTVTGGVWSGIVWFLQRALDAVTQHGRDLGSGRDDLAEPSNRDDRRQRAGDLVFGRASLQRPPCAPVQADRR
jgi:hypothetical protein